VSGSFYLTTAIDYSNGEPHLGHAYEKIGADCMARYRRLIGDRVHFVIGMDEHGQKVAQSAEAVPGGVARAGDQQYRLHPHHRRTP
jgi:methionyl-tRNA synthetase